MTNKFGLPTRQRVSSPSLTQKSFEAPGGIVMRARKTNAHGAWSVVGEEERLGQRCRPAVPAGDKRAASYLTHTLNEPVRRSRSVRGGDRCGAGKDWRRPTPPRRSSFAQLNLANRTFWELGRRNSAGFQRRAHGNPPEHPPRHRTALLCWRGG